MREGTGGKKRILFVCLGNICRSPAGEGVFKGLVEQRGLEGEIEVDSAGTGAWHVGEGPDPRMSSAAARRGHRLLGRARRFTARDFQRFDLIIAMDRSNRRDILALDRDGEYAQKVRLFCDFLEDSTTKDVPDPYYGAGRGFDIVLDMMEAGSEPILRYLQSIPQGDR